MSLLLMSIIREEMMVGPMHTFAERLHRRLALHFSEIKTEALREVVGQMKHESDRRLQTIKAMTEEIHTLKKALQEKLHGS